ncbi:ribbon-helix-helix domain-containing protein [Novosphingobium naphthalenivorans]|uniref:ribbon-helix-helix domain-containing protein n=1 Tax=Novosphingobium naphthalenivorans TaxID=273168 RepID=UPI00082ED16F|nr:ribbon-helix-helix domain-containing protein [Novosphingobium naphthalenivorans]
MGEEITRWSVNVDSRTDIDLRTYLAQRGMKKGDLSKFIEDAVKWRLLDLTMAETREAFADADATELDALIDEAVSAARSN